MQQENKAFSASGTELQARNRIAYFLRPQRLKPLPASDFTAGLKPRPFKQPVLEKYGLARRSELPHAL